MLHIKCYLSGFNSLMYTFCFASKLYCDLHATVFLKCCCTIVSIAWTSVTLWSLNYVCHLHVMELVFRLSPKFLPFLPNHTAIVDKIQIKDILYLSVLVGFSLTSLNHGGCSLSLSRCTSQKCIRNTRKCIWFVLTACGLLFLLLFLHVTIKGIFLWPLTFCHSSYLRVHTQI